MRTLIVYHRGGGKSLGYPPNSVITIKWALENNCKAVEYDVVACRDGKSWKAVMVEPALLKQNNFDMDNLVFNDLKELDTGTEKYGKVRVSELKEVMQIASKYGVKQQVHIKGKNHNTVSAVVSQIEKKSGVLITSFDLEVLAKVKSNVPDIKTGWIVKPDSESGSEGSKDLTKMVSSGNEDLPAYAEEELAEIGKRAVQNKVDAVILCAPRIGNIDVIDYFRGRGFEVGAWGVGSNLELARKLISYKIDRFTIDNPENL
ncbi:MAG: glycerophosphodiester phosphodiesterase [Candidatus Diapherotrites archaeon]